MSKADTSQGTVTRVVQVLDHLAENQQTSIKEISEGLGLAPSTSHRLMDLLIREGMAEREPEGRRYRVGGEFFRLAALTEQRFDIRRISRPVLKSVVSICDETCVLSLYDPAIGRMVYAEKEDSSRLLRYELPMNSPLSVLWGASGKSIAAFLPAQDIKRIYETEGAAPGSGEALPPLALLQDELRRIRTDGFAVSFGQKVGGAVGINAPVFGVDKAIVGSLGVTIPEARVSDANIDQLKALVVDAAHDLSQTIGAPKAARPNATSIPKGYSHP